MEGLRPLPLDYHDVDDWKDLKVAPAIAALERFVESGRNPDRVKALSRVMGFIEENKYDIYAEPDIIHQHLEAKLSQAEQVEYWARLINRCKARFGEYVELADNDLLKPRSEIRLEVEAAGGRLPETVMGTPYSLLTMITKPSRGHQPGSAESATWPTGRTTIRAPMLLPPIMPLACRIKNRIITSLVFSKGFDILWGSKT